MLICRHPVKDFVAKHLDLFRRFDSEGHLPTGNLQNENPYVVTDQQRLGFPFR